MRGITRARKWRFIFEAPTLDSERHAWDGAAGGKNYYNLI